MNNFARAFRPLAFDMLSTLVFVGLTALHVDLRIAVGLGMAVGVGQVLWLKLNKRPVAALQWLGLGLVVTFGSASLVAHDARFVMIKPTIVYLLVGGVMLQPGWMLRYMPEIVLEHGADLIRGFGYIWAAMMFATGLANAVIAWRFTPLWPAFIGVVPMASKLVLFGVQYVATRVVVRRRVVALRGLAPAAA